MHGTLKGFSTQISSRDKFMNALIAKQHLGKEPECRQHKSLSWKSTHFGDFYSKDLY